MTLPDAPHSASERGERPGNIAPQISLRTRLFWWTAALLYGVIASACFAPVEWYWLAWVSLVPLLWLGFRSGRSRFLMGYLFGLTYFTFGFSWLKEVFVPAPFGLALVCALYPAIWLWWVGLVERNLRWPRERDLEPRAGNAPPPPPKLSGPRRVVLVIAMALGWTSLEWIRSWFLSGFPWNQLGVSQWQLPVVLKITRFTGVYGVSFAIVLVNGALYPVLCEVVSACRQRRRPRMLWEVLPAAAAVVALLMTPALQLPEPHGEVQIAAVQGNIPQIRVFTEEELNLAKEVYISRTLQIVAAEHPDLVIWPETAIPKSLTGHLDMQQMMAELFETTETPMIVGTLEWRPKPGNPKDVEVFNSAVQFTGEHLRVDHYDKIKIVPFGEFTPFENIWPEWVFRMLNMGRSLTPGRESTIFHFQGLRIGMNICYEDIFPQISRRAVNRGANLLVTITNDAWYNETAGSRQHLSHAIFRAVENARPLLRNGNNSDTCLIMPNGQVTGLLRDPRTGNPFYRGAKVYTVPVWDELPLTLYTRYGNWFAHWLTILAALVSAWCAYRHLDRKRRLHERMVPPETDAEVPVTEADKD